MLTKRSAIFIILLIGLLLRLISANQSFWLDEAVQVWASQQFTVKSLITNYMPGDFNPPLYHLLTLVWIKFFNNSELLIRLLPIGLGTGSILVLWKIAKEVGKEKLAILTSLLLASSPLHIYYSQENRMYILASLGTLLVVWRLIVLTRQINWANSLWLTVSLLIMGFSHFLTLFLLPVLVLWT
ncbi:MAG: glycosyltransferase family 39 protein, partial [Patescibacteria group bacterium]